MVSPDGGSLFQGHQSPVPLKAGPLGCIPPKPISNLPVVTGDSISKPLAV